MMKVKVALMMLSNDILRRQTLKMVESQNPSNHIGKIYYTDCKPQR